MPKKIYKIEVNRLELNFILYCRKMDHGEITLNVHSGSPHMAKRTSTNVKFDENLYPDIDRYLDKSLLDS